MRRRAMAGPEIERLIQLLSKLPGLGPRSARRAALALIKRKADLMEPLAKAMADASRAIKTCGRCRNLDSQDPCSICEDPERDARALCIVEDVGDLWAMERAGVFSGRYHVLGGTLSALDGRGPDALGLDQLFARLDEPGVEEVILALNATVEGQATAHYIADRLHGHPVALTRLALGVPMGGELGYLDDGTLGAAFRARRKV